MPTPSDERERSYDGEYMEAGRKAEAIVLEWLRADPKVIGVHDLSQLRVMQEADVDCSLSLFDGRVTLVEIKSDQHLGRSGKVLFELLRINHTAPPDRAVTLGWSARSPARWLIYYAPNDHSLWQMTMDDLRAACQLYTQEARKTGTPQVSYVSTDRIKSTLNLLIPDTYVVERPSFQLHRLPGESPL